MALVNFFWTSILFPKQQLLYYFHCDLKQNSRKTKERPGGCWQTLASLCFLLAIFDRLQPFSFLVYHFSVISDASAVIICTAFSRSWFEHSSGRFAQNSIRTHPICPCHVYAYNHAITRRSVLKRLDFSQLWLSKRTVHFLPHKSISFCWKKVRQKYQNFLPLQTGSNASWPTKYLKSQT